MTDKKRKTPVIKTIISVTAVLLVLFVIVPYSISAIVLHVVFDRRFQTEDYLSFSVSDFEGLQAERHSFLSESGQPLVGYRYYIDNSSPKGLVVLSHGFGGGGQNGYLDVSYYFVQHGYQVFGYDATGNDESGGKVGGLEQGVKDLNCAVAYVRGLESVSSLPIMLWGHSWGGYSAICSLKYNVDIKAVAGVSAFQRASDMIKVRGVQYGGVASTAFLPYVRSVERIKFGEYASLCGVEVAKNSSAGVLIAHGGKDESVPVQYGYDAYYAEFSSDSRFKFLKYGEKGHTDILYSAEGWAYTQSLQNAIGLCAGKKERQMVINNIDRQKLCSRLNAELFEEVVTFYDEYVSDT